MKVLFLCTGNSCRSQMAEGWARHLKGDVIEAYSAGIEKHGMNPHAVKVMAVAKGEPLLSIETDKVNVDIESPGAGYLSNVHARRATRFLWVKSSPRLVTQIEPVTRVRMPPASSPPSSKPIAITPLAKRLAQEFGCRARCN